MKSRTHLGNVLSVISDKPIPFSSNSITVEYYLADILSSQDYSPFGVTLEGRNYTLAGSEDYRYGFQGQEMDDEVKGEGNSVNYKYRMHDPRVGRFFAVDPLASKYPWYTPYQFAGNKVIWATELEGLEENYTNDGNKQVTGETIGVTEAPWQGPVSNEVLNNNNLVGGSTLASATGHNTYMEVFFGKKGDNDGGKYGGHTIIIIDGFITKDQDYPETGDPEYWDKMNAIWKEPIGFSFSNSGKNHLFAKSGEKANSKYGLYTPGMMNGSRISRTSEIFELNLTLDQAHGVMDSYVGQPSVDYSITGWRCSSHALKVLNDVGIFELSDISIKYFHAINPGALARFMEKQASQ